MEENVKEAVLAKAILYSARAREKRKACQLALEQMKTLGKPESDQDVLQANIICGHLAATKGDYKDALAIFEQNERLLTKLVERKRQVDALMQKGQQLGQGKGDDSDDEEEIDPETYQQMQQIQNEIMAIMAQGGMARESDLINCRLELTNIRLQMEDWVTAQQQYQQLMTDYPQQSRIVTPAQQQQVFLGFARCLYEEGNYVGSIRLGEAALAMNRHFPGIHKYLALAHKAQGNLPKAQQIMAQAVLYETPWDPNNVAEARSLWVELMEEG